MKYLKKGSILNQDQYRILKVLGSGGFGITYLAESLGHYMKSGFGDQFFKYDKPVPVVIKELYYDDFCNRDENTGLVNISNNDRKYEFQKLVKNQIDEGKIIKSLDHPNIVTTRDVFEENGTAYMVMDFIESEDLSDMIERQGKLEVEVAIRYILQILDAANYFHNVKNRVLHLDITPNNIIISKEENNAVLIDFGASLIYNSENENKIEVNTSQIITGRKKHYSPNEQGDLDILKTFDPTFDTYAIGATLYHMVTGQKPQLSSQLSTGREKFRKPSEYLGKSELNINLDRVIEKAMSPFYNERYKQANDFKKDLCTVNGNSFDDEDTELITETSDEAKKEANDEKTEQVKVPESEKTLLVEVAQKEYKKKTYKKVFVIGCIGLAVLLILFLPKFFNKANTNEISTDHISGELSVFEQNGLFGYKIGDSIIINPRYAFATPFNNGLAKVSVNDSTYLINEKNEIIEIISLAPANTSTQSQVSSAQDIVDKLDNKPENKPDFKQENKVANKQDIPQPSNRKTEQVISNEAKPIAVSTPAKTEVLSNEYISNVNFAKRMINANGIDKCKANPDCRADVIESLNDALKFSQGSEAKELLNKMKN